MLFECFGDFGYSLKRVPPLRHPAGLFAVPRDSLLLESAAGRLRRASRCRPSILAFRVCFGDSRSPLKRTPPLRHPAGLFAVPRDSLLLESAAAHLRCAAPHLCRSTGSATMAFIRTLPRPARVLRREQGCHYLSAQALLFAKSHYSSLGRLSPGRFHMNRGRRAGDWQNLGPRKGVR